MLSAADSGLQCEMGFLRGVAAAEVRRDLEESSMDCHEISVGSSSSGVSSRPWSLSCNADFARLEQAVDPGNLTQETIIENMSSAETQRLARVRNIGIAVC
jgi:hypothetical protein